MDEDIVHFIGLDTLTECGSEDGAIALQPGQVTCRECITSIRDGEWYS